MFTKRINSVKTTYESGVNSHESLVAPMSSATSENIAETSRLGFHRHGNSGIRHLAITHKNHKNINKNQFDEIKIIDQEIENLITKNGGKKHISSKLEELLDKKFFKSTFIIQQEQRRLFDELNACPIYAFDNDEERVDAERIVDSHTNKFIEAHADLIKTHTNEIDEATKKNAIESIIKDYLKSNRSDRARFEQDLSLEINNGSAQKMALETFSKTLPAIKDDYKCHVHLLKKLIDVLPNLECHDCIQRSPQRRGLKVLEKALKGLPADDIAEVSTHLIKSISDLSGKLSKEKLFKYAPSLENALLPSAIPAVTIGGATGLSLLIYSTTTASIVTVATVSTIAASGVGSAIAIPLAIYGAAYLKKSKALQKQPQGTALYLLKNQLAKLHNDWGSVTPEKKQGLINAFSKLKDNLDKTSLIKHATLKRFFNDDFIDPSKFKEQQNQSVKIKKQLNHRLFSPIKSRLKPLASTVIHGHTKANAEQKELLDLLLEYHQEAQAAGIKNADFPVKFLKNFIDNTKEPEFKNSAKFVYNFFNRIKETEEYKNPFSKPNILNTVVEMTSRLAGGDKDFVTRFVSASQFASEDCHNNARQFLKILTNAVITDKAMKGEDGLDNYENLLRLGQGFFREQVLKAVTREFITHKTDGAPRAGIEVEIGNAVEIALGDQFNIPNAVKGMGYTHVLDKIVTPESLKSIEKEVKKRVTRESIKTLDGSATQELPPQKTALIDFLMAWDPLTEKVLNDPNLKIKLNETIREAREKFTQADEAHGTIPNPTEAQNQALEAAGAECQATVSEAKIILLRKFITELLDRPPEEESWRQKILADLNDATPATDAWLKSNNFEVIPNNGNSNNCLILSLLQHSTNFFNDNELLNSSAHKIRENLIAEFPQIQDNDMLDIYSDGDDTTLQSLTNLVNQELANPSVKALAEVDVENKALNPVIVMPNKNGMPTISGSDNNDMNTLSQRQMIIYGRNGILHFEAVRKIPAPPHQ